MFRKLVLSVAFVGAMSFSVVGCRSCDSYRDLLGQLRENLAEGIGPRYKGYLEADPRLSDADRKMLAGEVDDSVAAIDRVLGATAPVESAR